MSTPDTFTDAFLRVLEENDAKVVDKKKLEEGLRKAYEQGYDAGYSYGGFRWWKIWEWL